MTESNKIFNEKNVGPTCFYLLGFDQILKDIYLLYYKWLEGMGLKSKRD